MAADGPRSGSSSIVSSTLVAAQFALVAAQFSLCSWITITSLINIAPRFNASFDRPEASSNSPLLPAVMLLGVGLVMAGFSLAVWALLAMGVRRLRVFPEPGTGAKLVSRGPYSRIRHPMYSGLLLAMLGFTLLSPSGLNAAAWCMLVAVLWLKARREEQLLVVTFDDYPAYMRRTGRFVPKLQSSLHTSNS